MADAQGAAATPLALPPEAASAAAARRFVRERVRALGHPDDVDAMALAASEMVTNAALHARTPITVDVVAVDDGIRLTVTDASPVLPEQRRNRSTSTTGRGMHILAALGTVGVETLPGGTGKTVWFVPGRA